MKRHIAQIALLVADHDEAIAWYARALGFAVVEDISFTADRRWVVLAPSADSETRLLLVKATTDGEREQIGNQAGGRVLLFLHTDNFERDHARMLSEGVHFRESPRHEAYGTVAVFEDICGNAWDLLQPA